jgi:hypothetical protein
LVFTQPPRRKSAEEELGGVEQGSPISGRTHPVVTGTLDQEATAVEAAIIRGPAPP